MPLLVVVGAVLGVLALLGVQAVTYKLEEIGSELGLTPPPPGAPPGPNWGLMLLFGGAALAVFYVVS